VHRHLRSIVVLSLSALLGAGTPRALAAASESLLARPSDKGIESLFEQIGETERKFEKALDGEFRKSVLRGPEGEVDVSSFLDDVEAAIERARKRFSGEYSASNEVRDLLDRTSRLHRYVRNNPTIEGANEWDAVALRLGRLAAAYGTEFPLPEGAAVRRVGDAELVAAADTIERAANDLSKALGKMAKGKDGVAATAKAAAADLTATAQVAKSLESRIRANKPASAEARRLASLRERLDASLAQPGMPADATSAWKAQAANFEKIVRTFGLVTASPPDAPG
jgi:hypothetical protein